jgi:hypothetical protein
MLDDEQLSRLLRLKRYETPGEEYFDNFLEEFHKRVGAESARVSAREPVWERLRASVSGLFEQPAQGWSALAGGCAVAVVAFMFIVNQPGTITPGEASPTVAETDEDLAAEVAVQNSAPGTEEWASLMEGLPALEEDPLTGGTEMNAAEYRTTDSPLFMVHPDLITPVSYSGSSRGLQPGREYGRIFVSPVMSPRYTVSDPLRLTTSPVETSDDAGEGFLD